MLKFLLLTLFAVASCKDPSVDQLVTFKEENTCPVGTLTTSSGAPIDSSQTTSALNQNLLRNDYLIESMFHINRKIRPERYVHAKGAGAFGYFEATHDISHICKAKPFSKVGKRTNIAVRFSLSITESAGIDTVQGILRGFAVRYYSEDGNLDILGTYAPMFAIKDPLLFSPITKAQRRNPTTFLHDKNLYWDFTTLHPESLYLVLYKLSNRGIPDGYRHMAGYSIHTYQVYNEEGESFYIRFQYDPEQGIKSLLPKQAREIGARDPDYAIKDLYNAIAKGDYPSWNVSIQVLTKEDVQNAGFDVFDLTKTLPQDKYPLHPVGRFVLNRNPKNYFAEMDSIALNPANLIRGVRGAPDKMFQARCYTYRITQSYRLGSNYNNIPVNCPFQKPVYSYIRDGVPPINENIKDMPDYYPNSFNGPAPIYEKNRPNLTVVYQDEPDNFQEMSEYYLSLSDEEHERIVEYFINNLCVIDKEIQERALKHLTKINDELGSLVTEGVNKC